MSIGFYPLVTYFVLLQIIFKYAYISNPNQINWITKKIKVEVESIWKKKGIKIKTHVEMPL